MIIFENDQEIDIRSISTFGISVKNGENPIGFFGTGLKYAIAVLLRTGHQVTIMSGKSVIKFGLSSESVRGKDFSFVTMATNGAEQVSIGFTTELGKQWELWMAYREIACNCKDEGGVARVEQAMPEAEKEKTKIIIKGQEFESVFANRHFYLLEDKPWLELGSLEVRCRSGNDFYYRGVQVSQFDKCGMFTYNTNEKLELTEDRTVKDQWKPRYRLAVAFLRSTDKRFLRTVLTADNNTLEGSLQYHGFGIQPSQEFLEVIGDCAMDRMSNVNSSALKVWKESTQKTVNPREIDLTPVQHKSIDKALQFCKSIGFPILGSYPIKFVESLGDGVLGLAQDETIFIAERVFHLGGTKQLASTLIEEYLHLRHGWEDMSRELQSFLFEKLVSIGEELVGEPL